MLGVKIDYNMSAWKKTLIAGLISYIDAGSIVAGLFRDEQRPNGIISSTFI